MPSSAATVDGYTRALTTLQALYDTYLAPQLPPAVTSVLDKLIAAAVLAQPYITRLVTLFTSLISTLGGSGSNGGSSAESTALVATAVMILTLYLSLRVLNYVRRMVMAWVVFAVKFVLVIVGVQVVFYINRYGWENALRDASWWGGLAWGFLEEVLEGGLKDDAGTVRGMRSRNSKTGRRQGGQRQYAYQGRDQVPAGGRTRWT